MSLSLSKSHWLLSILILSFIQINAQITEEVKFRSTGLTMNGTLSLPDTNHRFPLIILVHGSGPSDRNQTAQFVGGNYACLYPDLVGSTLRNFQDLSIQMNLRNYAVFRYDKRTFTHQFLNPTTIDVGDFVQDGVAAVEHLKDHRFIDSNCIILLGHSQGASLIPEIAMQSSHVSHLISLAGLCTPIDSIYTYQVQEIFYRCEQDTITADSLADLLYVGFDSIRTGTYPEDKVFENAYPHFWKSWIDNTDSVVSNYRNSELPALFLQGSNDFNVPKEEMFKFEQKLGNSNYTYVLFDSVNHYGTYYGEPNFQTSISDTIAAWLNKQPSPLGINESNFGSKISIIATNGGFILESNEAIQEARIFNAAGQLIKEVNHSPFDVKLNSSQVNQPLIIEVSFVNGELVRTKYKLNVF